jgi:hypothetical protein
LDAEELHVVMLLKWIIGELMKIGDTQQWNFTVAMVRLWFLLAVLIGQPATVGDAEYSS